MPEVGGTLLGGWRVHALGRCFPTKAVAIWGQTDDAGHIWIVGSYYKFSNDWADVKALDITDKARMGDPMFVVQGTK